MNLPNYAIEKAVGDSAFNNMECVRLDVDNRALVATDGHQMVVIHVDPCQHDKSGLIPKRAFTTARDIRRRIPKKDRRNKPVTVQAGKRILVRGNDETVALVRPLEKTPLRWKKIIEAVSGPPLLTIDVEVLAKAVAAMNDNGISKTKVSIWVTDDKKPTEAALVVAPGYLSDKKVDRVALVMPCRNNTVNAAAVTEFIKEKTK